MERRTGIEDECVVDGAIAIALRISRVAGLAPLRFERSHGGAYRVTISRTAAIVSGIAITLLRLSMFSIALVDMTPAQIATGLGLDSKSSDLLFFADVALTISVTSIGVFTGQRRMRRFFRILTLIQELQIKANMVYYGNPFEPRPWKVWVTFLGCILSGFSLILFNFIVFIQKNIGKKSMALMSIYAFYIENILAIFLILQDAFLLVTVYSAVKAINARILQQIKYNYALQRSNRSRIDREREIYQYFLSFCNILDLINQSEGILLLLLISGVVLYILVTVYYLALNLLFSEISLLSVLQVISQTLWLILHSSKLVIMIEPCHQLYEEMKNTKYLLSTLLSRCTREKLEGQQLFLSQTDKALSLEIPSFSLLGIVTFGRPLLASIAGGVTTFFLILIQFHFKA